MNDCELILGDCLEKMKKLPDNSVDLVLTDPPYLLNFMGKEWDRGEDDFNFKWSSAVFPKLKPGAFLVFTMSPRQDLLWRCLAGLEKAGFVLGHSGMFWLYHTGFPKAMDVSKAIDKRKGVKGKVVGKELIDIGIQSGSMHAGRSTNVVERDVVDPGCEEAQTWKGWKSFSIKPAVECIVVAQKPRTEKTIVGQVLDNGCGAVNVGACRIPYASEKDKWEYPKGCGGVNAFEERFTKDLNKPDFANSSGRFPANLLVSGEPLKGESSSGSLLKKHNALDMGKGAGYPCYGTFKGEGKISKDYEANSGSPNRFYSLDAWAAKRNITLTDESAFFDVPKPSKAEKDKGLEGIEEKKQRTQGANSHNCFEIEGAGRKTNTLNKNNHPTCKPVALFAYLAEMFCQPGGLVLDPFMGSGTTGIACIKVNKRFIGIEKEEEYFKIAEARIRPFKNQTRLDAERHSKKVK